MNGLFITRLFSEPEVFFMLSLIVVFSICLHEYAHARTALAFGDPTAAMNGHLTLNPLKQMGVISLVMLLFIGVAWGAVPVNEQLLRSRSRWGVLFTSLAGPFTNFILALTGWSLLGLAVVTPLPDYIGTTSAMRLVNFIFYFGFMNIIPLHAQSSSVPGLDGWNALRFFFPRVANFSSEAAKGIMLFLFFAVLMSFSYLAKAARFIMFLTPDFFEYLKQTFIL